MKKMLLGTLFALCALSSQTLAAQNNCCFDYNQCCADGSFDGFYIGGNIAVFTHQSHRNDLDGFLTDNSGWTINDTSFAGGLQAGWDWQCGNRVIGIVGDWSAVTVGHNLNENPNGTIGNHIKKDLDWYSTIRARAGLAVCDTFVYVTAGAAVANFETKWDRTDTHFKHDDTRWGWTGGVGAEFLYCSCFSVGVDLLYLHFADNVRTFHDIENTAFSFGHSDSCWTARLSVNYRM